MKISLTRSTETMLYAAEELIKYLTQMDGTLTVELSEEKGDIVLGLLSDLGLDGSDVKDAMVDDVVDADIDSLCGYIAGSNERSVLFGVYKYLRSAGCRWVRPGDEGEYIPKKSLARHTFKYRKKAEHSFRGQCIEGAVSFEHLRDTVMWLPKVDMNLFMIEQIVPYDYLVRWYRHLSNTKLPHDDIPYGEYCEYCERLEHIIKKCGLQLHVLGHGAITEPFGIRHKDRETVYDIPDEIKKSFALVDGKRELIKNSPFFTQMCMSQASVQDRIVDWLADYLREKPHIDFLHFWLGDSTNNHCECEECVRSTPSDLYVQMLNKLDAKLTAQNNDSKIIFILYVDTLWPPIREKLNNPDRFIVTTACGSGEPYSDKRREGGIPVWERNNFSIRGGIDMGLSFVDAWKPIFDGPKFLFEYFMYTGHYKDPGYMAFSRQMAHDVKTLKVTGFDGIMSDQTQRSYFPTGLPVSIFGEFLFDTSIDTEQYIDGYMSDAFGADWRTAKAYLEEISATFDLDALIQRTDVTAQDTGSVDRHSRKAGIIGNTEAGDIIAKTPQIIAKYADAIKAGAELSDKCHRESWRILTYHAEYCRYLSEIYFALSRDDSEGATAKLSEAMDYLSDIEPEIHPYFDLFLFNQRTKQIIAGK